MFIIIFYSHFKLYTQTFIVIKNFEKWIILQENTKLKYFLFLN